MRGKGSFEAGFKRGAIRGAAFGAIAAGVKIISFGYAMRAPADKDIEMANRAYGIGSYGPVYRSGGVVGWIVRLFNPKVEGIAMGRNLLIMVREHNVFKHETAHYYQQLLLSPTTWAARIIPEQFRPGPLEWGASMFE
jgi:hypothetical protein